MFNNFKVTLVSDLIGDLGLASGLQRFSSKPDHSLLSWCFNLNTYTDSDSGKAALSSYTWFDRSNIPYDFLSNRDHEINSFISRLESEISTQESVDKLYSDLVTTVKDEMSSKLRSKDVVLNNMSNNKKRKFKKPWWTQELSRLWNDLCEAEKLMLRSTGTAKRRYRDSFNTKRKLFDKCVQREKRKYWYHKQEELESITDTDNKEFWKSIGRIGVGGERKKNIPMEVTLENGNVSRDINVVLDKWKSDFATLLNPTTVVRETVERSSDPIDEVSNEILNREISFEEVVCSMRAMKSNKAYGVDELPAEVLKNENIVCLLIVLFNKCFVTGITPTIWKQGIIQPIPKSSTSDTKDPLSYRGITLTPVLYKMYCTILNKRLVSWDSQNNIISDNQNGFRKGRSTIDQISTLTNIIETRKYHKQSTFAAFIDFKKAYDCIDRNLLFAKLCHIGISGNMMSALVSIYKDVKCCIRLNGFKTDWLNVDCGLKQGCSLSPILFNFYVNDLITQISDLGLGIDIDGEKVAVLLYADDLVILSETEYDLQAILDTLHVWCSANCLFVNPEKSKIIHFRPSSRSQTDNVFRIGDKVIETNAYYTYLGLMLTEHLDYNIMAKNVALSANRALGLVISKYKAFGGLPFNTFTKLYDSIVLGTISYGAAIWGDRSFSCISAVQHRAARFFMGVGKYTPNAAVMGDTGWESIYMRQWDSVVNYWYRVRRMEASRINFKVFKWAVRRGIGRCNNWCARVKKHFQRCGIIDMFFDTDISQINIQQIKESIKSKLNDDYLVKWRENLDRHTGRNGNDGNKLRTYRIFKHEYKSERYITNVVPRLHRSAYAKFRCGVAPLKLETGRYERLHLDERYCFHCAGTVESEKHVILECPLYDDLRYRLFSTISCEAPDFVSLSDDDKLSVILGSDNIKIIRVSAKTCYEILMRRRAFLYN